MPRPKQRTPELRDQVLAAAVPLLARVGTAGFTARAIAREAHTSPPAIYELFGDKAGVVREVFFAGFRALGVQLEELGSSADPRADLMRLIEAYRKFIQRNPALCEVMFSRPFADFDPGPSELEASSSVRIVIVDCVRRCVQAGFIHGEPTDIAHVLVALIQGLAAAESARRLGTSRVSIDRRWELGVDALLAGFSRALSS